MSNNDELVPIMVKDIGGRLAIAKGNEKFNLMARLRATYDYCEKMIRKYQ